MEKIRKRFYRATYKRNVENWCRSKFVFQGKALQGKKSLCCKFITLERLQMDILGSFSTTMSGNKYFLVIIDCFIKWVKAFPLKSIRAKTAAEIFVNQVISRHGSFEDPYRSGEELWVKVVRRVDEYPRN